MPLARLAIAALIASAIPPVAHANQLSNGSFELGVELTSDSGETGPITGWTVGPANGTSETMRLRGPMSYPGYPLNPSNGDYFVALNQSPDFEVNFTNWIQQPFNVGNGENGINVSFDMSTEFGSSESSLTVGIWDSSVTTLLVSSSSLTNTAGVDGYGQPLWDAKSWSTPLAPGDYVIRFTGVTDFGSLDVLLDNVDLSTVPEPATLLMLASALGMLGASRHRRRPA